MSLQYAVPRRSLGSHCTPGGVTPPLGINDTHPFDTCLHRHPPVAKYKCVYDVQLLAIWRIPLLAVVLLLMQSSTTRRPFSEIPHQPLSFPTTVWKEERCVQVFSAKLVCFLVALLACCRLPLSHT